MLIWYLAARKMKIATLIIVLAGLAVNASGQTQKRQTGSDRDTTSSTATAFRMQFDQVFKRNTDGSFSPLVPIQINGEAVNTGVQITSGIGYGGVDVTLYQGHYLLVDTIKGVYIIRKFLK